MVSECKNEIYYYTVYPESTLTEDGNRDGKNLFQSFASFVDAFRFISCAITNCILNETSLFTDLAPPFPPVTYNAKEGTQFTGNFHTNISKPRHKSIAWANSFLIKIRRTLNEENSLHIAPTPLWAYQRGS